MEIVFSPIGYRLVKRWQRNNIGKEYFDQINLQKGEIAQ